MRHGRIGDGLRRRDLLRALGAAAVGSVGCSPRRRPAYRAGRIVVPFWYAFGDRVRKLLLEQVAAFNALQSSIWIEPVHQGDYFEALAKLRTALAARVAPPLSHVVAEVVPYLARAGVLEPLDDYEGARELPLVPVLAQAGAFDPDPRRPIWGIPLNRSTPIMFANGRALEEERAPIAATWDDLMATARRLTRRLPGGETRWGIEVPISWWYWAAMVGQAGGRLVDAGGGVTLGGDAGVRALKLWQRLVREDRVMRPPPGGDYQAWQSTNESFLRGHVAVIWSSIAYVRYLEQNATFPVVAAPLPRDARWSVPTGGTFFVLLRDAPDEEKRAAWQFVRFMCGARAAARWASETGYMPVTQPALRRLERDGFYATHPNDRVAVDQLAHVDPWPWSPGLFRIERDIVEPRLEEAVLTGRNADDVMREARAQAASPA